MTVGELVSNLGKADPEDDIIYGKYFTVDRYTGKVTPLSEEEFERGLSHQSGYDSVVESEAATSINGEEEILIRFK